MSAASPVFSSDQIILRDALIENAVKSVHKHETRDFRKEGCLEGLRLCKTFNSLAAFEDALQERQAQENEMRRARKSPEDFWRYRCATAQLEFIHERMRVICGAGGEISARAVIHVDTLRRGFDPRLN